ncbi:MAG: AAA family ATPase [Polyangiaceae bacterium]|nr:AAA family ATPase [Polyangiaceae bacterium]
MHWAQVKRIFVAATRQNDGKTVVSLGLLRAWQRRGQRVGYMKPVGQSYRVVDGQKIDKDVVLMNAAVGLDDPLSDMSPIAIPRGFTEDYIRDPNRAALAARVTTAFNRVVQGKDRLLLEGTGHAGVGSVFDMSNADVAKLLDTKVVLVSQGGIGKPIDEIMMNKAKFDVMGAEVAGVIVNKVDPTRYDKIAPIITRGLERLGLEVFGVLPYDDHLSSPSVAAIRDELDGELLSGQAGLANAVSRFVVADMLPHEALSGFASGSLLLLPGNREETILAAFAGHLLGKTPAPAISGIVFTGGIPPHPTILERLGESDIPLIQVKGDTFSVASCVSSLVVKLRAEDTAKIARIDVMIEKYVDLARLDAVL